MIRSIALYLSLGGCLAGGFEVALEWAMPLPEVVRAMPSAPAASLRPQPPSAFSQRGISIAGAAG